MKKQGFSVGPIFFIAVGLFLFSGSPNEVDFSLRNVPLDDPDESPVRRVEFVVLDAGKGGPVRVGIHVELEPGWHLYWENPGDAGLAPSVRWTLPPGFTAGPLRHPVPEKAMEDGLVSYEHRGDVLLISDINPASDFKIGKRWEAVAVFEWMACRESCLTGEAAGRAGFPPDDESLARGRALLDTFASRFPRPFPESGLTVSDGKADWTGSAWRVAIALAGARAAQASDFFAAPIEGFLIDNSTVSCRDGRVVLHVVPSRGAGSPPPPAVGGVVIIDGTGYEVSVPVTTHHANPDNLVPGNSTGRPYEPDPPEKRPLPFKTMNSTFPFFSLHPSPPPRPQWLISFGSRR